MATITRRLEFDAGHRVYGHEGKCRHLHGHRYTAEVTVESDSLDSIGRVIDFGVIKIELGAWIEDNWDHNLMLNAKDPLVEAIRELNKSKPINHEAASWEDIVFGGREPYIMPNGNPTAENMASDLFRVAVEFLPSGLKVTNVRIYETPNCWADCSGLPEPEVLDGPATLRWLETANVGDKCLTSQPAGNIANLGRRAKLVERGLNLKWSLGGKPVALEIFKDERLGTGDLPGQ